jgi:multiple sugar transport system permease protein
MTATTATPAPEAATSPAPGRTVRRRPLRVRTVIIQVVLALLALIMISPLIFGLLASLTPLDQLLSRNSGIVPERFEWRNYADAWTKANFSRYFLNSVLVTGGVVVLDSLVSSMIGYVLARRALRGQKFLEGLFVATLFVGLTTATLYPQYKIADALGMGNLVGVTLVELTGVMLVHIFLLKAFVLGLGEEMEQAARVDGCGFFSTYWRVTFPMMRPMLITTVILGMQASWNNYQVPLVFSLAAPDMRTLVVGVSALQYDATEGMSAYNTVLAGANLALIPIVIVFIVLQKFFVQGWTEGSTKG